MPRIQLIIQQNSLQVSESHWIEEARQFWTNAQQVENLITINGGAIGEFMDGQTVEALQESKSIMDLVAIT